jgi:glycosyltransferase involved in cell wall biosynthesis
MSRNHSLQISVVMAVYNGERFLAEAMDSILQQSFTNFELIVVNDGSTDGTSKILADYAQQDARVVIIHQSNRGVPASVNRAISISRCDLIARMDSDDRMLPHRLERQLAFFNEHPEASVVCGYGYMIDIAGRRIGRSQMPVNVMEGRTELNPSKFLEIIQSTVLMRKSDVLEAGAYREDITYAEDRELWGRLVTNGKMFCCQPEFLVESRLHGRSMTTLTALRNRYLCAWIDENVVRRLKGIPELSKEEFQAQQEQKPWIERLRAWRRFKALFHYKNATRFWAEGQLFSFATSITVSILFQPLQIVSRIVKKAS